MTTMAKKETVQRNWYVLDAAGKPLGRTAVTAAKLLRGKHKVDFIWVKGHAGHELNERCDELATTAADGSNLDIDAGFNESDL